MREAIGGAVMSSGYSVIVMGRYAQLVPAYDYQVVRIVDGSIAATVDESFTPVGPIDGLEQYKYLDERLEQIGFERVGDFQAFGPYDKSYICQIKKKEESDA